MRRLPYSKSVPATWWAAKGRQWTTRPATLVAVTLGNWLYGTGEALFINANIGQTPGTVLAQGISSHLGVSVAWSTFYISVAVMLLWVPLRQAPGLGTLINIVLVSVAIAVMSPPLPHPTQVPAQVAQVLAGIATIGVASALYITSNLGPGPRDGLMTGLHDRTGVRIGRVRLGIEVVVMVAGWLLGGTVGIGTALFGLLIGQSVAVGFGIVSRLTAAH